MEFAGDILETSESCTQWGGNQALHKVPPSTHTSQVPGHQSTIKNSASISNERCLSCDSNCPFFPMHLFLSDLAGK